MKIGGIKMKKTKPGFMGKSERRTASSRAVHKTNRVLGKTQLFVLFFFVAVNSPMFSQITLDSALAGAVQELNSKLYPGTTIAVVNFNSASERMTIFVMEELNRLFVQTQIFTIVERNQIDLVREELDFQMSGEVSDETFQGIGHMLGAESIVTGSIERVGKVYRFRVWAIDVRSAQIGASYSANVENDRITASLMGVAADLVGLSDYTPVEQHGAFLLNLIPLGSVGSWMMGDWKGAILSNGLQVGGFGLMVIASTLGMIPPDKEDFRSNGTFDQEGYDNADWDFTPWGIAVFYSGLGATLVGYIFNLARPYHVHKPPPKNVQLSPDNLHVAYIPNTFDGTGEKIRITYKIEL
jgi:hypothetical protein